MAFSPTAAAAPAAVAVPPASAAPAPSAARAPALRATPAVGVALAAAAVPPASAARAATAAPAPSAARALGAAPALGAALALETFAPTIRCESVRLMLAEAAAHNLHTVQMDVTTAFLYEDLQEEVYLEIREGMFGEPMQGKVIRLCKALYGLK